MRITSNYLGASVRLYWHDVCRHIRSQQVVQGMRKIFGFIYKCIMYVCMYEGMQDPTYSRYNETYNLMVNYIRASSGWCVRERMKRERDDLAIRPSHWADPVTCRNATSRGWPRDLKPREMLAKLSMDRSRSIDRVWIVLRTPSSGFSRLLDHENIQEATEASRQQGTDIPNPFSDYSSAFEDP